MKNIVYKEEKEGDGIGGDETRVEDRNRHRERHKSRGFLRLDRVPACFCLPDHAWESTERISQVPAACYPPTTVTTILHP